MKRILTTITSLFVMIFFAGIGASSAVIGDDMAPSIMAGDRVWLLPNIDPLPGDVVAITDPLDPAHTILRRVLAVGGQTISYDEGTIRVGKRRLRKKAMGDAEEHLVAQETLWAKKPDRGHEWLTRQRAHPATHWSADPVIVADDALYLLADDRDEAIDSRWWGTVPKTAVQGVVRLRWGTEHTWRPAWEWTEGTAPIHQ
jgi:signal peptidase I